MIGKWIRLLLVVCALGVVLAACGDDEGSDATSTASDGFSTGTGSQPTGTTGEPTGAAATQPGGDLQWDAAPEMQLVEGTDYKAVLHTSKGDITIDILEGDAPIAANNFVFLAQQGYYTNVPFHRIIEGFMIQGGDPTGTGSGGPGYTIQDEPVVGEYTRGTVAMARTSLPNSAGSQFFIMHQDSSTLPKDYVIFGQVLEGMDVVDAIATSPVVASPSNPTELSSPQEAIMLNSVDIVTE